MCSWKKRETAPNKKIIHLKKRPQQAGGYRIGFLQFPPLSRKQLWWK